MTAYGRTYTAERKQQGFRSQAHLDAFYAAYDHSQNCPDCQGIGGYVELTDGMQPVAKRCEIYKQLDQIEARIDR